MMAAAIFEAELTAAQAHELARPMDGDGTVYQRETVSPDAEIYYRHGRTP